MRKVSILQQRCPQNHFCPMMNICPTGAISQESPYEAPTIDESKCTNCEKCTRYCAYGAFQMI